MAADLGSERRRIVQGLQKLGLSAGDAASVVNGEKNARLPEERSLALVAFDADAVQAQVFASPRPVTIQGASRILRKWDEDMRGGKTLEKDAVVLFAGGGQAVLLAHRDRVACVTKKLRDQ